MKKPTKTFLKKSNIIFVLIIFLISVYFAPLGHLFQFTPLEIPKAHAATGDITAVRIAGDAAHNGWTAEIDIEGLSTGGTYNLGLGANNDPSTSKIVFTVTSPGYDTSGNATTVIRTIYGTKEVRKAYPSEAQNDESEAGGTVTVKVALSDFIYSGDTSITVDIAAGFYTQAATPTAAVNDLAVTNSSVLAYPKSVGRWAWPSYESVTTDFLLESVVFNRFAKDGKPLSALKYTCVDENSHTITQIVNNMTVSTRTGDANKVLVYAATMPVASLTQGDVITCNFTAYPWVGDSGSLLNSDLVANGGNGFAQPDERLGPFALLNNKAVTYGEAYAVVDPVNGQDSSASTWVYASQAAAESAYAGDNTLSYKYVGRATAAIKAYNNTSYSRNEPGGGKIILIEGSHTIAGFAAADSGVMETWLIVTKLSTASRANVVIVGDNSGIGTRLLKYTDLNFTNSSFIGVRGNTTTNVLWMHNNTINMTGTVPIYQWKLAYATQNSITALSNGFKAYGGEKSPWGLIRGNTYPSTSATAGIAGHMYAVLGNKNIMPIFLETGNAENGQVSENAIAAFNTFYNISGANALIGAGSTVITHGLAYVQNLIEISVPGYGAIGVANDSSTTDVDNVIIWNNTVVGERTNLAYNDTGSAAKYRRNWSIVGTILDNYNNKDDTFITANANRVGAWPVGYAVGALGNFKRTSVSTEWFGEFDGINTIARTGTLGFVDNNANNYYSGGGDASGNGNYHLTASSSALNLVPSGQAVLPFDLEGNARHNNGFGAAGAYEWDVTAPTVTAFTIPTTSSSLTVSISSFTATDAVGVTGYIITESSTPPAYDAAGWSGSAPANYVFSSDGSKTLYAWSKDAVGNVSTSSNDSVTITLPTYTIGGTISSLTGTVVLRNNGGDDLSRSASGVFTFATELSDSASYAVTVFTQPSGQTCVVSNGSGTVSSANITNVSVACTTDDATPPVRSAGSPSGALVSGTTGTTMTLTTNETATCKYGTITLTAYGSIASTFATTAGTSHSQSLTGLTNGSSYNYYVRCIDTATNANTDDYIISFSVDSPPSSGGSFIQPPSNSSYNSTNTNLAFTNIKLVVDGETYYVIKDNKRYGVANPGILFSYGLEFSDGTPATQSDKTIPNTENLKPGDGGLVKKPGDTTVYLIFDNSKHGFTSESVFNALGYSFSSVLEVTANELDALPIGTVVANPDMAHPNGTFINQDGTIFRISQNQKFGIPSMDVYNSFNADDDFSHVMPANAQDRLLPIGLVLNMRGIN